jgi:hypothetical protein
VVAAVALRGTVPGAQREPREPAPDNPASLVVVLVMLFAAVGVVVLAVVVRARQRTAARASVGTSPEWLRRDAGRLTWRAALVAFLLVLVWSAIAVWLSRLGNGAALDPPGFVPGSSPDPVPTGTPPQGQPAPQAPTGPNPLGYFATATAVFLLVLAVGTVIAMRRPRSMAVAAADPVEPGVEAADDPENLARAAEVALAEVEDPNREPRKAIIACYVAMERELARVPGAAPQEFDTASEVLARAVDQHALRAGAATQLVDLFDEARFSPHVMNEGHRAIAVDVLNQVLTEMRARA